MDTVNTANEETDVIVIDLCHDDVLQLIRRLEIKAACHIDKRDCLTAQCEQAIDIGMGLWHGSHRHTRNDLAYLRDIDAVVHFPYAELNNLKFVCSCLKQDALFLFGYRICHLSLPLHVNILRYALYSPLEEKILPWIKKKLVLFVFFQ